MVAMCGERAQHVFNFPTDLPTQHFPAMPVNHPVQFVSPPLSPHCVHRETNGRLAGTVMLLWDGHREGFKGGTGFPTTINLIVSMRSAGYVPPSASGGGAFDCECTRMAKRGVTSTSLSAIIKAIYIEIGFFFVFASFSSFPFSLVALSSTLLAQVFHCVIICLDCRWRWWTAKRKGANEWWESEKREKREKFIIDCLPVDLLRKVLVEPGCYRGPAEQERTSAGLLWQHRQQRVKMSNQFTSETVFFSVRWKLRWAYTESGSRGGTSSLEQFLSPLKF